MFGVLISSPFTFFFLDVPIISQWWFGQYFRFPFLPSFCFPHNNNKSVTTPWWQCHTALPEESASPPRPLERLPQLHLCRELVGKQTKLSLMSSCISSCLWTQFLCLRIWWMWWTAANFWLAYFPLPFQVKESSSPGFEIPVRFSVHLPSHSHYYANVSFTWRQELSS